MPRYLPTMMASGSHSDSRGDAHRRDKHAGEAEAERLADPVLNRSRLNGKSAPAPKDPAKAAPQAVGLTASSSLRPGGTELGWLERPTETVTGTNLRGVRVHHAPRLVRAVGAQAFARGREIFVGHGAPDRVMAHEAVHVAQQTAAGRVQVQCWSDPTTSTLTPQEVYRWSAAELLEGLRLLLDQMAPVDRCVPPSDPAMAGENLRLIIVTAVSRSVPIPDDLLARVPPIYGPHSDALFPLFARIDLMAAMLARDFPDRAAQIAGRFEHHRNLYPWLDAMALDQAKLSLDASLSALETATRIHRAARDPGGDAEFTAAIAALEVAIANLLDALLTPGLASNVAEVEAARDEWLGQIVGSFSRTITDVRDKIGTPLDPQGYGYFSRGTHYSPGMRQEIAALEQIRALVARAFDDLGAEVPSASVPLEERLDFVATRSAGLDELLALAEKVAMGAALCRQGQILADMIWDSYQISEENYRGLAAVTSALTRLVLHDYRRADMPQLRALVDEAFKHSDQRVESIRSYERKVTWFINIAATLLGIGAMRAVMAIPAVAGLGRTGATIVGSLAFTGTRLVLTNNQGRPWTVGGVLEDAAKDYFLLRLLGGVDARVVARVGEAGVLAAAARVGGMYGTLVAWTLTWNAIQPGAHGPTGAGGSTAGDIMVQTGVDLAVLLIAEAMLRAPVIPAGELAVRPDVALRRQARGEWETLRREMENAGRQLREWLSGSRADARAGDALLTRAARLFARTKELHARFAEMGEITDAQRAQLDVNADAMQESIRNARDEVRLDVRNVTPESWSYRGPGENIAAYLERLKTQGRVTDVTPEGNGIYAVRTADGSLQWFFPAGREAPGAWDLVAESVEASAPGVAKATRSQALVHLRGAGWSDLGAFAGGLPGGRGTAFIEWVARPDAGAAIASNALPMPVVRAMARAAPEQLAAIARGSARPLPFWFEAWIGRRPGVAAADFVAEISDVLAWRGTLEVASVQHATALLTRRAEAVVPVDLQLAPRAPSAYPAIGRMPPASQPLIARALQGEIIAGARYSEITRFNTHFVLENVSGRITRLFKIAADGRIVRRVPVGQHLSALRELLNNVYSAPDEIAARTALARSEPLLRELDVLMDFREGVPVDHIHLIETLAAHPLRGSLTLPAPPATATPSGGAGVTGVRVPRRIIVRPGQPPAGGRSEPRITLEQVDKLARRRGEPESAFIDRVISAQERAYWEALNGPAGRRAENPARWARIQPELSRLVAAMRNMQGRLQRAGRGDMLPEVNDAVLNQPVDLFVMRNPVLRQARLEIEARLRENSAREGRELSESPEWNALQDFLGRGRTRVAKDAMGRMRPDIVEFLLEQGRIHISDVTIQRLDPLSVHAFKTRVYVEIMKQVVGPNGPRVFGQDIQMRLEPTGRRIDPSRTEFGELIE